MAQAPPSGTCRHGTSHLLSELLMWHHPVTLQMWHKPPPSGTLLCGISPTHLLWELLTWHKPRPPGAADVASSSPTHLVRELLMWHPLTFYGNYRRDTANWRLLTCPSSTALLETSAPRLVVSERASSPSQPTDVAPLLPSLQKPCV